MINLDFSNAMASSTGLLDNAESILENKLNIDPDNIEILWQLGQILRQKGDLPGANETYKRLLNLKPDNKEAAYLTSIFEGKGISKFSFKGAFPAPFLIVNNFLEKSEQSLIWENIKKNEKIFANSKINGDKFHPEYRKSNILLEENIKEIKTWFLEKIDKVLSKRWNNILKLQLQIGQKEIELNMHGDGGYYKIHKDSGDNGEIKNRKITFVYYFYNTPRKFKGGDLLLFDTDPEKNEYLDKFTRVKLQNNSLILFPSNFYHLITPVHCASDNIEDFRFTINGWLYQDIN